MSEASLYATSLYQFAQGDSMLDPLLFVIYIAGVVLLPIIISTFANLITTKKLKRHSYGQSRSEYVTRARFDKEIDCIQDLSAKLLLLIQMAKSYLSEDYVVDRERWNQQRDEALVSLGKSAPFLNYLDTYNSNQPYCGVATKKGVEPHMHQNSRNNSLDNCENSLEKHCPCNLSGSETRILSSIQKSSIDSLYIDIPELKLRNSNLYQRACEIIMLCEHAFQTGDTSCVKTEANCVCRASKSSNHEYRTYLDCRYERFVDCAYCRLNTIEYGRESIRKNNKRAQRKLRGLRKWREEIMCDYDQSCPYAELSESE